MLLEASTNLETLKNKKKSMQTSKFVYRGTALTLDTCISYVNRSVIPSCTSIKYGPKPF
jgi:hypothetical protein